MTSKTRSNKQTCPCCEGTGEVDTIDRPKIVYEPRHNETYREGSIPCDKCNGTGYEQAKDKEE